jgi:integrase/recombinase XerD
MTLEIDHRPDNDSPESSSGFTQRRLPKSPDQHSSDKSSSPAGSDRDLIIRDNLPAPSISNIIPAFAKPDELTSFDLRVAMRDAIQAWLVRSPSPQTRDCYTRDLKTFLKFASISEASPEQLTSVRPALVAAYRDHLREKGLGNAAIVRKLTVLRSLFSYLTIYGYTGANPAHSKFVDAPKVPRDGKTVGLSPADCRRLLEAPDLSTPAGIRDRAILTVLAYSACRVGELSRLKVKDYREHSGHKILEVQGKGGKERRIPLHAEAFECIEQWLDAVSLRDDPTGPLFRGTLSARGKGRDGFVRSHLSRRAVQALVKSYVRLLGLDSAVTVHSFRVTALTTARERGADIIDIQDFAGHSDPRTTLAYIRSRDRLSKSPAYVLRY